jgi:hypothetical protein
MDIQKLGHLQDLFDFLTLFWSAASEDTIEMGVIVGSEMRNKILSKKPV